MNRPLSEYESVFPPEGLGPSQYCRRITKNRAKNFFWAIATLSADKRAAVYSIYAFARRCDDIADSELELDEKRRLLEEERNRVRELYRGYPADKLYRALQSSLEEFSFPQKYLQQLIDGVQMDLDKTDYETFEELKTYCYHVASVVGLILIEIFGYSEGRAQDRAIDLGIGMQLINIIRDVGEDLGRGRIYLPEEDLERFELLPEELEEEGRNLSPSFKRLIGFEAERARCFIRSGEKLIPLLPLRSRPCPAGLYGVYEKLLDEMERSDWDVLRQRVELSKFQKIKTVLKQWLGSIFV